MNKLSLTSRILRPLSTLTYPGASAASYTSKFQLEPPTSPTPLPCYRILTPSGQLPSHHTTCPIAPSQLVQVYQTMLRQQQMDTILLQAQRQGRIAFYMTSTGEEASVIGSASSLDPTDTVFSQYREHGVLLHRGASYDYFCSQCTGNGQDGSKGRQMPMHFGSIQYNFPTVSSPLATQIPHAVGAAYADKLAGKKRATVVYFGDGAASEGDFATALNMASVLQVGVLMICRNNGYAISTKVREQYRGDGIASRGKGYGVVAGRVDGNDAVAVMLAVKEAREKVVKEGVPVLLELMTYRKSHHSTSDDASRYRSEEEMKGFEEMDPVERLKKLLVRLGCWNEDKEKVFVKEEREKVVKALEKAEKMEKVGVQHMFTDVYKNMPMHLKLQQKEVFDRIGGKKV